MMSKLKLQELLLSPYAQYVGKSVLEHIQILTTSVAITTVQAPIVFCLDFYKNLLIGIFTSTLALQSLFLTQ